MTPADNSAVLRGEEAAAFWSDVVARAVDRPLVDLASVRAVSTPLAARFASRKN